MFNDEEEDENAIGAVRYPCMPSLVALQQMRNRLHLAYLGRKLMKWTALATGRELRRLAMEINTAYNSFAEDLRNAFMLLARGRYFYPNLNKMVLENVPNKSSVLVASSTKTISGVKVIQYDIVESGVEPYEHLGIEKGGQKIHEAKIAWLDLLKRMVLMLELRTSFSLVETAHKNATKKFNVLGKVVVPRTNASIGYIISELEELAREEFFRLKKILEIKKKLKERDCGHRQPVENCEKCKVKFANKKMEEEECLICGMTLSLFPDMEKEEDIPDKKDSKAYESMLELFKKNINDIIEITEDVKGKGIAAESVEKFLSTASELREKLGKRKKKSLEAEASIMEAGPIEEEKPVSVCEDEHGKLEQISSNISVHKLCDMCIKRFEEEQAAKGAKLDKTREEQDEATSESAKLIMKKELEIPIDLELGVFETEYQQITKIIRVKKEDGTISEETRIIKTKKETKAPVKPRPPKQDEDGQSLYQSSGVSSKSNPYPSGSKTVGMFLINDSSFLKAKMPFGRRARSEMLMYVSSMTCPVVRYCMSSTSMLSSVNFDLSYVNIVGCREHQNQSSDLRLKELYASSSEIQLAVASINQSKLPSISHTKIDSNENEFESE